MSVESLVRPRQRVPYVLLLVPLLPLCYYVFLPNAVAFSAAESRLKDRFMGVSQEEVLRQLGPPSRLLYVLDSVWIYYPGDIRDPGVSATCRTYDVREVSIPLYKGKVCGVSLWGRYKDSFLAWFCLLLWGPATVVYIVWLRRRYTFFPTAGQPSA